MSGGRRVKVTSPQTRLALARGHRRHPQLLPLPAPADAEAARTAFAAQRRTAVRTVVLLAAVLFGSSGLIAAFPVLDRLALGDIPLSWLLPTAAAYPLLLGLAASHVRRAERVEARVAAAARGTEDGGDGGGGGGRP